MLDARALLSKYIPSHILMHLRREFNSLSDCDFSLRLEECLKCLYLFSYDGGGFIPVFKEIDEFWHALILQTEDYAMLCRSLPGGQFVHHKSGNFETYSASQDVEGVVRSMVLWLPRYVQHFGPLARQQAELWTISNFMIHQLGMSLDDVNALARSSHEDYTAEFVS